MWLTLIKLTLMYLNCSSSISYCISIIIKFIVDVNKNKNDN